MTFVRGGLSARIAAVSQASEKSAENTVLMGVMVLNKMMSLSYAGGIYL